jgi:hypothetical protein
MIVVRLMGGLGNQMFQYALGRRMALEQGVQLKLDLSWFDEEGQVADTPREYALAGWRIDAHFATRDDLRKFKRIWPWQAAGRIIREPRTGFHPDVLAVRAPVYLIGYWQNENYFRPIERLLRDEFELRSGLTRSYEEAERRISTVSSVSLHIRRGDYVTNPATNAFHGTCSVEYYRAASALIQAKVKDAELFIFSDDLEWARRNVQLGLPSHFIDHDAAMPPEQDVWLMSRCRYHIIANSSFSWWSAWLSPSPAKIVIAPNRWFNDPKHDCRDIVPPAWIVL